MSTGTVERGGRVDGRLGVATHDQLPWLERVVEEVVGNRIGARVYRDWVEGLGLRETDAVLEVGVGAGACARHLAEALPLGRLTCIDIDPRWVEVARRRLDAHRHRIEFVVADAGGWSRHGAFDAAVAHFVLHDMPSIVRGRALRSIAESLAPGGVLHLREPLGHGMGLAELREQLAEAGFRVDGIESFGRLPLMGATVSGRWVRSESVATSVAAAR